MASGLVAQYAGQLQQLDSTATAAGVSYHLTELPQAPPPPPPVTDIVDDGSKAPNDGSGQPGDEKPGQPGDSHDATQTDPAGSAPGAMPCPVRLAATMTRSAGAAADPLLGGDAAGSAMGGDPMQQIAPMAAMLPSALAGALGGAMGAVTSVPQQVGQQVMGAAQQIMQGAASSMEQPEDLGLGGDPLDAGLSDLGSGGLGSGGGGGGGGGTEPAGLDTSLPPGGGALAAASAPSGGAPPVLASSGAVHAPTTAAPAGAGMGMGMMPPMMGGMGGAGGAGRTPAPPDKTVVIPSIPNGEPVKGEVERRQTASVDDAATAKAESGDPAAAGRPRRRVVMSAPSDEGESK